MDYLIPTLPEFLNEGRFSNRKTFRYVEDKILEPLADALDLPVEYVTQKTNRDIGEKIVQRFYRIGPVMVMALQVRPAGMRRQQDAMLYIMRPGGSDVEKRYDPSDEYKGFIQDVYERVNPNEKGNI